MTRPARSLRVDSDIKPISELRANAAELIEQMKSSGRPLVLTQHGHSTAVVLDLADYQAMIDELELLRDVRTSMAQLGGGEGLANRDAKARLKSRFRR